MMSFPRCMPDNTTSPGDGHPLVGRCGQTVWSDCVVRLCGQTLAAAQGHCSSQVSDWSSAWHSENTSHIQMIFFTFRLQIFQQHEYFPRFAQTNLIIRRSWPRVADVPTSNCPHSAHHSLGAVWTAAGHSVGQTVEKTQGLSGKFLPKEVPRAIRLSRGRCCEGKSDYPRDLRGQISRQSLRLFHCLSVLGLQKPKRMRPAG